MQGLAAIRAQLSSCMEEALQVCHLLQRFTAEAASVFTDGLDTEVIQAIEARQSLLDKLAQLEGQLDGLLTQWEEAGCGSCLPDELEDKRKAIRQVLNSVAELDEKAMESVHRRMQLYKDKTLDARNRKHLSAYLKSSLPNQDTAPGEHAK